MNNLKNESQDQKKPAYLKLYIAVLDEVDDYMTPTLVAHSILGAHLDWWANAMLEEITNQTYQEEPYINWLTNSYAKCVIRVNRKEFEKIKQLDKVYLGHENKTLNGEKSCAVVYPVMSDSLPNVLKFAKLWSPNYDNKT